MPPADIAAKIASALDVTVEYLVTGQEVKKETIDEEMLVNGNAKSIIQILVDLNERDVKTIHALSKILEAHNEKK